MTTSDTMTEVSDMMSTSMIADPTSMEYSRNYNGNNRNGKNRNGNNKNSNGNNRNDNNRNVNRQNYNANHTMTVTAVEETEV